MKKILSVLLCALCVVGMLCFTACNSDKTPVASDSSVSSEVSVTDESKPAETTEASVASETVADTTVPEETTEDTAATTKEVAETTAKAETTKATKATTAAAEPAGDGTVAYISFGGADANTGTSADSPKKTFGQPDGVGVMSLLGNGGTMVVVGKAYVGGNYTIPFMTSPLTITSVYGGKDYKNAEPADNPACAFKMASGVTLTIEQNVTFDNIILFQENNQNTIHVGLGGVLTITDTVQFMAKTGVDYHYNIILEPGAKAILSEEAQRVLTVENNGGEVTTYKK